MSTNEVKVAFENLELVKYLENKQSPFAHYIKRVYEEISPLLNHRIPQVFPHYTMHDIGHSLRIIKYMSELINDIDQLSDLEITLLIYSALLHDIGMAISEEDVKLIKEDKFLECNIKYSTMLKLMNGDETLALQEYIRNIHSTLSARYVRSSTIIHEYFTIPGLSNLTFTDDLAKICQSHTEDYDWIKKQLLSNDLKGDFPYNSQYIACILRIADILDIDNNRTPYNLFKLLSPPGTSEEEWKQNFIISNNNKIFPNPRTNLKTVRFQGTSTSSKTHRKLLEYISWVQREINSAIEATSQMHPKYNLLLEGTPDIRIQSEGYTFSDYKMTLQFRAISSLLMGEKIYGDKSLGLRELIQNAMDACRTRQENQNEGHKLGEDAYIPKIKIILNKEDNQVIIKDNGAGMSLEVIKKHFLNIGVSYYSSREFALKDLKYKPIGNFGIGFLSCFMLSDDVRVITKYYQSGTKYIIELEKGNEYTSLLEETDYTFEGTEVILNYSQFMAAFSFKTEKVREFIQSFFLIDEIEFHLFNKELNSSERIYNQPRLKPEQTTGLIRINLSEHLSEVHGYALIKPNSNFVKRFEEIHFDSSEIFLYSEEHGITPKEQISSLDIDDYITERQIEYLSIPIVEEEMKDNYLSGLKFTNNDVEEVIRKMEKDLRWINVIFKKEEQKYLSETEIDQDNIRIYDNFTFDNLVAIGHQQECATKTEVKKIFLYEGFKNNLYLPFEETQKDHWSYLYPKTSKLKELFIRSVLIKDFAFLIPTIASLFDIVVIEANILSRKVIPDISRNKVDIETARSLNYAMGKAIHTGALKALALSQQEKITLENFINTYYSKTSDFESR